MTHWKLFLCKALSSRLTPKSFIWFCGGTLYMFPFCLQGLLCIFTPGSSFEPSNHSWTSTPHPSALVVRLFHQSQKFPFAPTVCLFDLLPFQVQEHFSSLKCGNQQFSWGNYSTPAPAPSRKKKHLPSTSATLFS